MDTTKYMAGDLLPPRPRVSFKQGVTAGIYVVILFRIALAVAWHFGLLESVPEDQLVIVLWASQIEMVITVLFFGKFARWEDQGHLITMWQFAYVLVVLATRQALYDEILLLCLAFVGLYATYIVGIYAEFTKLEERRLPPFPYKKNDTQKPRYGWLGKNICSTIQNRMARKFVTAILYFASLAFSIFMMYAFLVSEVDDLRNLKTYKANPTGIHVLTPLLLVAIVFSVASMIPPLIVESGAIPGLLHDLITFKRASRSYRTGVWDICELDEDKDGPGEDLKQKMKLAGKLEDLTIVLPCYLPNEEEIIPFVFSHFLGEFEKLAKFESQVLPGSVSKKNILLVWNSPDQHPDFQKTIDEWKSKFENKGFGLESHSNPNSTSKCDNLNRACDLISTNMCLLNDADTMIDWSCMVRGSIHITSGIDIAQAMNSHCMYDCRGTPGDEQERQCHPYGILITIGDSTKPQNMSTQTPFKHAPFNGRGGFWRTDCLKKVGFDSRTVGEDHDAGYRGFAYFGFKGILDMNMLCQEQEPPNCSSLTSQRIRWETAALEMRRTFSWIIRSPHYTNFEIFVLLWGQLQQNCNLPFQSLPYAVSTAFPLIILKGWLSIYGLGPVSDKHFCAERDCVYSFQVYNPITEHHWILALPLPLVIFIGCGVIFLIVNGFDFLIRVVSTRYRPNCMFFIYYGMLKSMFVVPFFVWVQYWALYDYCWGGAKFIATARSPVSPTKKDEGSLEKPLLNK